MTKGAACGIIYSSTKEIKAQRSLTMYHITLTNVRGSVPISLQVHATSRENAIKTAQKLLTDMLCTSFTISCRDGSLRIYDEQGLHYKGIEVTEHEETDRKQKIQHHSSAKDRIWRR